MPNEFEHGVFIEECKNRFLCKVAIKGQEELCYVSSSSKLSHFIKLPGRQVLLIENLKKTSKTKYTLHAVKTVQGYALLNLGYINKLLMDEFSKQEGIYKTSAAIHREKKVTATLKSDFLVTGEYPTIIEAKGILSESATAYLPSMQVNRAVRQLNELNNLLKKGFLVHYYIILMDTEIKRLLLSNKPQNFYSAFTSCLENGMRYFIFKAAWNGQGFILNRDLISESEFLLQSYN